MASREVWSLFTGAMGLDIGLELAGIQTTLAVEIEPTFCSTIRLNRPDVTILPTDVSTLSGKDLYAARHVEGDVDLMVGGPPCQSFSTGGKRASIADPRGNLIFEYLRLIREVQPRFFVLENVANLITAALRHRKIEDRPGRHWSLKRYDQATFNLDNGAPPLEDDERSGSAIRQIMTDVSTLGYSVVFGVLDAADYGAPQHRLRFVMIGGRDELPPSLPTPTHGRIDLGLLPYVAVRDAIAHLQNNPGPHSEYTSEVRRFFSLIPEGGNWRSLPPELQPLALGGGWNSGGGKTGFFRRLAWDKPSPTITGRPNRKASALCHPTLDRPLSVRECANLQGFPETWQFSGSMNAQYTQVGNAVPVALGHAVGRALVDRLATAVQDLDSFAQPPSCGEMLDTALKRLRSAARNHRYAGEDRTGTVDVWA